MKPYNHWGKILKDTNLWKLMYSKKDPLLVSKKRNYESILPRQLGTVLCTPTSILVLVFYFQVVDMFMLVSTILKRFQICANP
jgi:hypothetical protein